MSGQDAQGGGDRELSDRLKRLDAALGARRAAEAGRKTQARQSASTASGLGRAFRMSTEFIAGILAGGGLGWLFDRLLGTSPLGLIVLLLLGFAAGILNLLRASKSLDTAAPAESKPQDPWDH